MAGVDDMAGGECFTAGQAEDGGLPGGDAYSDRRPPERGLLRLSVALSVCIHLTLAALLVAVLDRDAGVHTTAGAGTLRVEFVPGPTRASTAEAGGERVVADTDEPRETAAANPAETALPDTPVATPVPLELADTGIAKPAEAAVAEAPAAGGAALEAVPKAMPELAAVRSAIDAVRQDDASRFYSYDCNRLELEREFRNCQRSDSRDYAGLTENPVYDSYKRDIGPSRSRASQTTIAKHSIGVSATLALSAVPAGLSAYVLEEIEQGIETYSNGSNRAIQHMNNMVNRSAATVQARRVFDHWVVQQSAVRRAGRVEGRVDATAADDCADDLKFILAPQRDERCWSEGNPLRLNFGL